MSTKSKINLEQPSDREIIITRVVKAPRALVWEAWTNPHHVAKWWGPNGFSTIIEKMEVRVGGEWRHVMRGPDGTEYPNQSKFVEIVKPERIVYEHAGARRGGPVVKKQFTWTFIERNGGTEVTIHMVFESKEKRDQVVREFGAIEGGKQTLARLDEFLQKQPS